LGQSGDAGAKLIWVRDAAGRWRVEHAGAGVPIIDAGRLGAEKMARLRVLAAELLGHKEGAR